MKVGEILHTNGIGKPIRVVSASSGDYDVGVTDTALALALGDDSAVRATDPDADDATVMSLLRGVLYELQSGLTAADIAATLSGLELSLTELTANAAPYIGGTAVVPSDTIDLTEIPRAIYVGTAGNLSAVFDGDAVAVDFAVAAGATLPIAVKRINATGTTASGLVALY